MYKKFTILLLVLTVTALSAGAQSMPVHGQHQQSQTPKKKILKVYPVPATTQVTFEIQGNNEGVYEIIVYNFLGKKMDELKSVSNRETLNLNNYYSGIYIYQLRNKKGNLIESGKFNIVKQ